MFVSADCNSVRTWLVRACIAPIVAMVIPVVAANAQDFKAIEKRLGAAVEDGEINAQQARLMMEALRRNSNTDAQQRKMREGVEHRIVEIKKLVESGKMSKEEGMRLIRETRKALGGEKNQLQDRDHDAKKRRYAAVAREIKEAIEAGKLSREEAEKKLVAVREEIFGKRSSEEAEAKKLRDGIQHRINEIEKLVKSGELSRKEGARLIEETRGNQKGKKERSEDPRRKKYAEMQQEIKAAMRDGKLTQEDAKAKLLEVRKEIFKD